MKQSVTGKLIKFKDITGRNGIFIDGDWVESKDQDPTGDVRLIQLADVGVGDFLNRSSRFLTSEKAADLKCTFLKPGDVLIARMPDPIGRACIFPGDLKSCVTVVDVCIVRPDPELAHNRWLMWAINSPQFRYQLTPYLSGTTRQRISRRNLQSLSIKIPPIAEQRRIAEILDRADAIRRKRQAAIALTEELLRSTFLEMFANLEKYNWEIKTVEFIASKSSGSIRTGPFGSQLLHSEFVDEGIAVLGIDNAVQNQFRWAKPRFITPEKYQQLQRYTVYPKDVLITIMGTCGRCAIVPDDCPTAINTKHLCCITLDRKKCLPEFLHSYFLMHPHAKSYLEKTMKGAIMDGLNMSIIKQLPVPLVPLELQEKYAEFWHQMIQTKQKIIDTSEEDNNLFNSLLQRAFRGEL